MYNEQGVYIATILQSKQELCFRVSPYNNTVSNKRTNKALSFTHYVFVIEKNK
jgi:hypothetical protein